LSQKSHDDDADGWSDDDHDRVPYVVDTLNSGIRAIADPLLCTDSDGTGKLLASGGALNPPFGLTVAPNGHILTVNGGDGNIMEFNARGTQLAKELIDTGGGPPPGAGDLFGLIYLPRDGSNTLNLLH